MWNNQLSGPIPAELGSLESLTWLDVSHNKLCGPIPPQLGDLRNLEHLNLSANPLSGGEIPKRLTQHPRFRKFIVGRAMDGPPLPDVNGAGHAVKILIVPVALGYLDLISDLYTAVSYFRADHLFWFVLVVAFALGPAVIVSAFFLREISLGRRLLVATQMSLLFEAVFSAASETYSPVLALVRVIEPLFEAVPQLLLQLYAMLLLWSETSLSSSTLNGRVVSVCISAVSLAYAATDVSSVEKLLNSRLLGEGGTDRFRMCPRCPSITGIIFSRVPEKGVSRLAGRLGWVHPRSHVWFCFLYHVVEVISRFVPLAMVALILRKWFFFVLPYLWISRCLVVWAVDYSGEAMDFRFRVRFVAMPFLDSILDGTRAFGIGLALTLVEFVACIVVYYEFKNDHLPTHVRMTLTVISSCCMVVKLRLAMLAIFPLKEKGYGPRRAGAMAVRRGDVANEGGTGMPALEKEDANADGLETAERGIQAASLGTSNQAVMSTTMMSAGGEDAQERVSLPVSTPPAARAAEASTQQVSSAAVEKAPRLIAGAVAVALGAEHVLRRSRRRRVEEGGSPQTSSTAELSLGDDSAPSSRSARLSPVTPTQLAVPRTKAGQVIIVVSHLDESKQVQRNADVEAGETRSVGDGERPLAHSVDNRYPWDELLARQAAVRPPTSATSSTAPAMDSSPGMVPLRHSFMQPFSAAVSGFGGPQPSSGIPTTQQAWFSPGVVGMPSYPQGMLALGVGGGAGVFQHMGAAGGGWRVHPQAALYSAHGGRQAAYTLGNWGPQWDAAAGMHVYGTEQPWLSRTPSNPTAPAASMDERLPRRAYHEQGPRGGGE
ncbi:unnamed protein product [Scytosiphon promiscuus]